MRSSRGCPSPWTSTSKAWAATPQRFAEHVRVNLVTIANTVRMLAEWDHLWTMWSPSALSDDRPSQQAPAVVDNNEMVKEAGCLHRLAAALQWEKDR